MQIERKAEILDAFIRLVSRFGIDKTTMQDVAKEVGISVGVIYKDFKNKEDLIDAYIERKLIQFKESAEQLVTIKLPAEQLLHEFIIGLYRTLICLVMQDRGFFQFLNDEASIKYLRCQVDKKEEITQALNKMAERILTQGVEEGIFAIEDIPKTATLYLVTFHAYSEKIFLNQTETEILDGVSEMHYFIVKALKKKD